MNFVTALAIFAVLLKPFEKVDILHLNSAISIAVAHSSCLIGFRVEIEILHAEDAS